MPDKKAEIKQAIEELVKELSNLKKLGSSNKSLLEFGTAYQHWYTKALRVVAQLAPDRYDEFVSYYQVDPKRKDCGSQNYVIQDFIMGMGAKTDYNDKPLWDTNNVALIKVFNQHQILGSLFSRIDEVLSNIEVTLFSELQDSELETATKLKSANLRAAGALAGVVLESHLQKVASSHKVKISKKDPTISELNDPLKNDGVYDTPTWRKMQYLADIRNLCSHKKSAEPTPVQIDELISGVSAIIKTVF
jgi:hypothetical protein